MGGIQAQHVYAGLNQSGHTVQHIVGGADGSAYQQAALLVTGRVGIHLGLLDVLDGNETLQVEVLVHDGQLLYLVLAQDLLGLGQSSSLGGGDQVLLGHHVVDELAHIGLKLHITVGDDADELAVVADGHTGDAVLGHQLVGLSQSVAGSQPEGIGDNAVLRALDHIHLLSLLADGHILMDDTDTTLTGDGNGHAVLGNGIHGGADEGDIQTDLFRQLGVKVHVGGQHIAGRRNEQNIIKGEALLQELLRSILIDHKLQLLFLSFAPKRGKSAQKTPVIDLLYLSLNSLSRKHFTKNHRGLKAGFALLVHTLDKVHISLLPQPHFQLIPRTALRQVADLQLREELVLLQILHLHGVTDKVGVAAVVHMAVDIGVTVLHPAMADRLHLLGQTQLGQLFCLAQLSSTLSSRKIFRSLARTSTQMDTHSPTGSPSTSRS